MWDQRYAESEFAYGTAPNDFLRNMSERLPGGDALCLAEGQGRNAVFLAGLERFDRVVAVDQSQVGLERARALAEERGVTIEAVCADLRGYDIGEQRWDLIVSIFAHVPTAVRERVHRGVVHGLRPGGVFLLEAYTPTQVGRGTGGPPTAELMMSLETLRIELEGLQIEVGQELERVVQEGRYHTGAASVVQVLARRA